MLAPTDGFVDQGRSTPRAERPATSAPNMRACCGTMPEGSGAVAVPESSPGCLCHDRDF